MGLGFRFTVYFEVPEYCASSHYVGCYAISPPKDERRRHSSISGRRARAAQVVHGQTLRRDLYYHTVR
jgi:hypothetical protein